MADIFDILKGLEQWAGSRTPTPGAVPASMGALRASESGELPAAPQTFEQQVYQQTAPLQSIQPTLTQMGQQYYSALSRRDIAGAKQIHQKANSLRKSIDMTPGADYDPATGYMKREGDVRPLGSINIEQEMAQQAFGRRMLYELSTARTGQPATNVVSAAELQANPYMNTAVANRYAPLARGAGETAGVLTGGPAQKNALGAVNQFGVEMEQAAPGFWKAVDNPFKPGSDWQQDPTTGKLVWNPASPQAIQREHLNTPGAQMVKGSPAASGAAQFAGAAAPWLVAGELTGGAADVAGLGGAAMQSAPWAARLAAGAGRGAVEGGLVSAMQRSNARQALQNILFGTLAQTGTTAMETVPSLRNLPNIIGRPLGTYGGVAGAVAAENALAPANERQNPTRAAAPLVLAELAMAALGGKGALSSPATMDTLSKLAESSPETLSKGAEIADAQQAPAPEASAATMETTPQVQSPTKARGALSKLAQAVASTREAAPEELTAAVPQAPAATEPAAQAQPNIVSKLKKAIMIKDAAAGVSRNVKFSDPTDAALYLARQSQAGSASRETYLAYLRERFPGVADEDILKAGDQVVRASRESLAADKESKTVKVKSTGVHPAVKAAVNLAAQAAAPTPQQQEQARVTAADPRLIARAQELSNTLGQRALNPDEMTELQNITGKLNGEAAPETRPAATPAEQAAKVKSQKNKPGLLLQTNKADGTAVEYHAVKLTPADVQQRVAALGDTAGASKNTAALKAQADAGKGAIAIMRVEKGTDTASSTATTLGYGRDVNESVSNISFIGKDGKPRPFAQEVLKAAKPDSPLSATLQQQMLAAQQAITGPTGATAAPTQAAATAATPAIADLVKQHGDQVMDALDKRVAGIDIDITGKNKAAIVTRARSLIESMRHVGLPVEEATSALEELAKIKRSDYDTAEDYLSDLEDAKDSLVEGVNNVLDGEIDPSKVTSEGKKIFRKLAPDNETAAPDPAAPAAQSIASARGLKQGDAVDAAQIADDISRHPDVAGGKVTAKQVFDSLEKQGIDVQNKEVQLYSGLYLPAVWNAIGKSVKGLYDSVHTRPTFKDISEIDGLSRSLSQRNMNKLPVDVQVTLTDKSGEEMEPRTLTSWLDKIDNDATLANQRIKEMLTRYGSEANMPKDAQGSLEKARQKLATAFSRREALRPAVEQALGEADKRPYSTALSQRMTGRRATRGFQVQDPLKETVKYETDPNTGKPLLGADGKPVELGRYFVNPVTGKDVYLQKNLTPTYSDVSMLKTEPSIYARVLGVARDVFGEPLVRPIRNALTKMRPFVDQQTGELADIFNPVLKEYKSGTARNSAMQRITYLIEGKDVPTAGAVDQEAATNLRGWYNQMFQNFGFGSERYLTDYSPRIRQAGGFIDQAFGRQVPQELRFAAEYERKLKVPMLPYGENAMENALSYLRAGSRRAFLQPALDTVEPYVNLMSQGRKDAWKEYTDSVLGRPVWDEKMVQGAINTVAQNMIGDVPESMRGRYAQDISRFVTHIGYLGTMGLNAKTAMLRMLHGLVGVYTLDNNPLVGVEYFGKALQAINTPEGRDALKYCVRLTQRGMYEGFNRLGADTSGTIAGKVLSNKASQALEKIGFAPFDFMDKQSTQINYMMQLLKSLDEGKPYSEAIETANTFTNDTQSLHGVADSAAYSRGPVGRMVGMLMSWPLNFARMLERFGTSPGERVKAVNAFVGMTAACWAASRVTGIDFNLSGPTQTLGRLFAPFQSFGTPVVSSVISAGQYLANMNSTDAETRAKYYRQMMDNFGSFIPFYVEGKRIGTLATAAKHDWNVYNDQGELLYRFGDINVPGEAKPEHAPAPGGLIPEQVRSIVGSTVEQEQRSGVTDAVLKQAAQIAGIRKQIYNIYRGQAKGSIDTLQQKLRAMGGKPMTMSDVKTMDKTRQQEQTMTYAQRTAQVPLRRGGTIQYPSKAVQVLNQLLGLH